MLLFICFYLYAYCIYTILTDASLISLTWISFFFPYFFFPSAYNDMYILSALLIINKWTHINIVALLYMFSACPLTGWSNICIVHKSNMIILSLVKKLKLVIDAYPILNNNIGISLMTNNILKPTSNNKYDEQDAC